MRRHLLEVVKLGHFQDVVSGKKSTAAAKHPQVRSPPPPKKKVNLALTENTVCQLYTCEARKLIKVWLKWNNDLNCCNGCKNCWGWPNDKNLDKSKIDWGMSHAWFNHSLPLFGRSILCLLPAAIVFLKMFTPMRASCGFLSHTSTSYVSCQKTYAWWQSLFDVKSLSKNNNINTCNKNSHFVEVSSYLSWS